MSELTNDGLALTRLEALELQPLARLASFSQYYPALMYIVVPYPHSVHSLHLDPLGAIELACRLTQ